MPNYFLFIDTETSGLPKNWNKPYATPGNWPHAIQVAWLIYTDEGKLVKEENFYLYDPSVKINPSAQKIHGITYKTLEENGLPKAGVLNLLSQDLAQYQPVVVGHCLELDFHILGAEYYRLGQSNPISDKKHCCTMLATTHLVRNPSTKYLRLGELYFLLFQENLEQQHHALVDARATAACFFEMLEKKDITEEKIAAQPKLAEPLLKGKKHWNKLLALVCIIIFVLYLWIHDWSF